MNKNTHRAEAYSEPCQTSKIELFTKIVRGFTVTNAATGGVL